MGQIAFKFGERKALVYSVERTQDEILTQYSQEIKDKKLPNLLDYQGALEIPSYLIGPYKVKGYPTEKFYKGCGTYNIEIVPELVLEVSGEESWERIDSNGN